MLTITIYLHCLALSETGCSTLGHEDIVRMMDDVIDADCGVIGRKRHSYILRTRTSVL